MEPRVYVLPVGTTLDTVRAAISNDVRDQEVIARRDGSFVVLEAPAGTFARDAAALAASDSVSMITTQVGQTTALQGEVVHVDTERPFNATSLNGAGVGLDSTTRDRAADLQRRAARALSAPNPLLRALAQPATAAWVHRTVTPLR